MAETPTKPRVFGPECGPEAIRQLTNGFSIAYCDNGVLIGILHNASQTSDSNSLFN